VRQSPETHGKFSPSAASGFDEHLIKPVPFGTLEGLRLRAPGARSIAALSGTQIESD